MFLTSLSCDKEINNETRISKSLKICHHTEKKKIIVHLFYIYKSNEFTLITLSDAKRLNKK